MTKDEIIAGPLDNAKDRRALTPKDESGNIFEHDAEVMEEAARLIILQEREIYKLRRRRLPIFRPYKGKRLKEG